MSEHGFLTKPDRHLGKKILLFGVVGFFVLLLAGYVGTTLWYYIQIKQGKTVELNIPAGFTAVGVKNSVNSFDRDFLEKGDFPYEGKKDGAEIVIVEFVDYNCPNCRAVFDDVKRVAAAYKDKVKIIYRQFPAVSISGHEDSEYLSKVAWCSFKQGKFIPVHQYLFGKYDEYSHPIIDTDIAKLVKETGLDQKKFDTCLDDPKTMEIIVKDFVGGVEAGVRGTPTFFVNGQKIEGAVKYDYWKKYLDSVNP